jgi:AcrR family transcriptional regulator
VARQRLVESARIAFEDKGYVDVTVDDIAQGAGASRGTFYLYFQSKSEILGALIAQLRDEVQAASDDFRAMGEPTVEALQAWFDDYVEFYLRHLALWRALHQAQVVEPDLHGLVAAAIDRYVDLCRSVRTGRRRSDQELRLPATLMYTFVDQFLYLWSSQTRDGHDLPRERTTRILAAAVHAALVR